jgi:O-acetyl-ADP-ribose deacetylase (regulator of RNase III)
MVAARHGGVRARMSERPVGRTRFVVVDGDITTQAVDAIVNAANQSLLGGGGVDGAIHRAGGPAILAACEKLGGCATGDAKVTAAGRLPAKKVIHAVGPRYRGRDEDAALLASCYRASLARAREHGLRRIAFPAVSTGIYGYPIEEATRIALATCADVVREHPDAYDELRFVCFGASDAAVYRNRLALLDV